MSFRVCLDCHRTGQWKRGRCPEHDRERDKTRGTRQARGYDAQHDQRRAAWQARIDSGERVTCWRPDCTTVLTGRAWHLGHDDHDRSITRGPECAPCNLRHAGLSKTNRPPPHKG